MSKQDRIAILKARHAILFGVALGANGLLPVTRSEVSREARTVKARVSEAMNDDTSEGDRIEAPMGASSLPFDTVTELKETDSNSLLNLAERQQLARDMAAYRTSLSSHLSLVA